jgi:hypothetical protein
MNGWVRMPVDFGTPTVRIAVSRRDAIDGVGTLLAEILEPEELATRLTALIVRYRPELSGGFVVAIQFASTRACWEIMFAHPSLPRTRSHDELPLWPLVPTGDEPQPDAVSGGASHDG